MNFINVVGSAMILSILGYVIADVLTSKKLTMQGLLGRVFIVIVLVFSLIRT